MKTLRLTLTDHLTSAIGKLAEGNLGAANVLLALYQREADIDPDSALGGLGTILALDEMNIYGVDIWRLYDKVCGQNLVALVTLFRGYQLGFVAEKDILDTLQDKPIDIPALLMRVQNRLPEFGRFDRN